jgi:hypothetical protein
MSWPRSAIPTAWLPFLAATEYKIATYGDATGDLTV